MQDEDRVIAIDLGGTRFRVAVATVHGRMGWRTARPTEAERGPGEVLQSMFEAVDQAVSTIPPGVRLRGIGIASPGPLDPWAGVVRDPPNLPGWHEVPLKRFFEERYMVPVQVGNDANLAALGEHRYGAGRGIAHLVYMTVSTGIGGGVIVDNRLLLGYAGFAGEIGHMAIDMDGPVCNCGNLGCLEALASGRAIATRASLLVESGVHTILDQVPRADLTAKKVAQAAYEAADQVAQQIIREAGVALGVGITNLAHLYNPQRIIVGGGVGMNAGPLLWDAMRGVVESRTMAASREGLEIVPAALGDDAGLLGAIATIATE